MLKVKQRLCGGRVIHWKSYCIVKLFLLATAVLIPKLRFLPFFFFFMAFSFVFISLINASIYSSFVLNYLPSQMLAVFALCHSLGGALANFDATRGLGICQPRGPPATLGLFIRSWNPNLAKHFSCRYPLKSTSSNMCCVSLHFFRSLWDKWLSISSSDSSILIRHDF